MADNPRNPEHYSDIPSSRSSGVVPNPASPSSGGGFNSPSQPQNTAPHSKTHIKNLLLGGVITIITSTVVFIITQRLKKPEVNEFQQRKEATVETWKSYTGYENAYFRNLLSYQNTLHTEGRDAFLKAMKNESEKFLRDIDDLKKRKKIDEDLIKVFSKRIENEKSSYVVIDEYFKKITDIEKSNLPVNDKKDSLTGEMIRFTYRSSGMYERALNDITEITNVLASRYGNQFSVNDFLLVQKVPQIMKTNDSLIRVLQNLIIDSTGEIVENRNFAKNVNPDNLIGKWTTEGAVITLAKNGTMIWLVANGNKATGTWKLENDKLKMQATTTPGNNKVKWYFNLGNITTNSFSMMLDVAPYNTYTLTRTLE